MHKVSTLPTIWGADEEKIRTVGQRDDLVDILRRETNVCYVYYLLPSSYPGHLA
jgi:hypothetical protein